jgi:4-amino-4-deoxy-L-arabinose transferase-like glycosyltransferase
MEGHGGTGLVGFLLFLPIYIPVIFLGMLPWSVALLGALRNLFRTLSARDRVILLAWFLPTFLAFSIAATKLPHYIFPTLAPLSVAIAVWLMQQKQTPSTASRIATMLVYLAYAAGLVYTAYLFAGSVIVWKMALAAAIFVAMAVFVLRANLTARAVPMWAAISLVMMQGFYWFALTEVDRLTKLSRAIGQQIHAQVPSDAVVINASYGEPSLIFYANRPVGNPITRVAQEQIAQTVAQTQTGYAVLTRDELALLQHIPNLGLETLAQATAHNLNQSGLLQTVLLIKWQNSAPQTTAP